MPINAAIASTCAARFNCRQHNVLCAHSCPLYIDLRYQFELSGIPDEYRYLTVEALPDDRENLSTLRRYADVLRERRPKNGLCLVSKTTGNGKTEAACAVAGSYIVARTKAAMSAGSFVQFVNITELLDLLRLAMNDDDAQARAQRLIERIGRAELVILDDLGAERPSEYVQERLYAIINGLWANRTRQTLVVTSNWSLDEIEIRLGARIRSRVDGLTIRIEYTDNDKRRKSY